MAIDSSLQAGNEQRVRNFVLILVELLSLVVIVYLFNIEVRRHFLPVFCLIVSGFAIHAWLPETVRVSFFAVLSVGTVLFVLGTVNGLWVVGLGATLIIICGLPVAFVTRVILLLIAAAVLVSARASMPMAFWPILGSMFMFRIVSFVHEHRRADQVMSVAWGTAYFFMIPNPCFPLFPIVDYKVFRKSWYDSNEWQIYQRGVTWIGRGLSHLLAYRAIKSYLVPEAYELYDIRLIAVFAATNYALYLQVSGQFHLITGLLHLFGFNLPPTHHFYFLASSFSDIWRRINIYWKDFLTKYVFFPTFYGTRQRGASVNSAVVTGVFAVFAATWLLHSWQTFWLLNRFPLTLNDATLWMGAGSLVALNAVMESKSRHQTKQSTWLVALGKSARTVGMFVLISLFWSCWTVPGFPSWILSALHRAGAVNGLLVIGFWIMVAILVGTVVAFTQSRWQAVANSASALDFLTSVKLHLTLFALIAVMAWQVSNGLMGSELALTITAFREDPTIAREAGEKLQSYYEDLNTTSIQAGPLLSSLSPVDTSRRAQAEGFLKVSRLSDMYQGVELIPGTQTELDGNKFSVNLFGMRDRRTMTFEKGHGVTRIALVGSSIVMGYGVSDDDVFARQFEKRLNDEIGSREHRFEVLNFGVGKQWAPHRMIRIQRKVLAFEPDAVYYFAHQDEFKELASHMSQLIANRQPLTSQHLNEIAQRANATANLPPGEIYSRLARVEPDILLAVYRTIVDECRQHSVLPVWFYLPIPAGDADENRDRLIPIATKAGFIVCDLSGWDEGQPGLFPGTEFHPNAEGHRLIAAALARQVDSFRRILPGISPQK